ncbi:hypothetical protein BJ508DRAFT_361050 [Ascobolus immersus RN42]|uniref:Uncharacterized protein n=1 Tax=Ascobolus immersus RN42 TaxID=1160509 RepID=A0A3N4I901_ASCIM|nr:hypothetical protein BJ508DRAFT_361050 [Ascobolus immersus RN42]
MSASEVCTFEGDNDLYGIGVRIGFYAQLLATQISFTFTSDSTSADSANIWFQLALSITLTYNAATSTSIHPIESHIVSLLLSSLLFTGFSKLFIDLAKSWSEAARGKPIRAFVSGTMLSILVKLGLMLWVHVYAAWFWWSGMDEMFGNVVPDGTECGRVSKIAFFFAKVEIDGWFRTFNKVINTWFLAGWVLGIGTMLAARYVKIENTPFGQLKLFVREGGKRRGVLGQLDAVLGDGVGKLSPEFESYVRAAVQYTPDPRYEQWGTFDAGKMTHEKRVQVLRWEARERVFCYVFGAAIGFVAILFIVLAVECMIAWNGIEGVNDITGTGQVVALILGVGNLASSLKQVYLDVRRISADPDDCISKHIRDVLGLSAVDDLIALTAPVESSKMDLKAHD